MDPDSKCGLYQSESQFAFLQCISWVIVYLHNGGVGPHLVEYWVLYLFISAAKENRNLPLKKPFSSIESLSGLVFVHKLLEGWKWANSINRLCGITCRTGFLWFTHGAGVCHKCGPVVTFVCACMCGFLSTLCEEDIDNLLTGC